jgi:RNA recognition motif-containing protein
MFKIFVKNVAPATADEFLREEFGQHAEVQDFERTARHVLVSYTTQDAAEEAVRKFDGLEVDGNKLVVENARAPTTRHKGTVVAHAELRVLIRGLDRQVHWPQLKDWGRESVEGAEVLYAKVFDYEGEHCGLIEYKVHLFSTGNPGVVVNRHRQTRNRLTE